MAAVWIALLVVFAIGAVAGIYAMLAPRRRAEREHAQTVAREPLQVRDEWNAATGAEFASLSESARCDMIFAVAALDDARSARLLEHALGDDSEAVALAAAHALTTRGRADSVRDYLASHPGERADRMAKTLALLQTES